VGAYQTDPDGLAPWRITTNLVMIMIGLIFMPLLAHAGGLGMAALGAIVGGVGLVTTPPSALRAIPAWVWAIAAFLGWAAITSFWSPYVDTQTLTNPWKLCIGATLYLSCILAFRHATALDRNFLRHMIIAISILSLGLMLIDIMSGYALTFLVDPLNEGEDALRKSGDIEMNIGHGITISTLTMAPVMMMMRRQLKIGWLVSIVYAAFVALTAIFGGLAIGLLAVIGSLIAMLMTQVKPIFTLRALMWLAILSILAAPIVGFALGFIPDHVKAGLPFSWEHRVEMWSYTTDKILTSPIWGHGFDASRTFDDTFSSRGVEDWPIVSLHPHNAGLHIWVETGLIGAGLATFALIMIGTAAEYFILNSPSRAKATTGFIAAVILISNVTFGVWQDWWWATIIFVAAMIWLLPKTETAT